MTHQERRALFMRKAAIGKERAMCCNETVRDLEERCLNGKISLSDALTLAFADGCDYGKEHAEDLKIFDQ